MTGIDERAGVPSLRGAAISGAKWTSISAAVGILTGIVQPLILVRLLSPRDFGLMAAVMVVIGFTRAFLDAGMSTAIRVRKTVSHDVLSSLFWATLAIALAMGSLVFLSAPLVVAFYGESDLTPLVHWAALVFAIAPLSAVHRARLERDLRFDLVANAEVAGVLTGLAVAVTTAALGAGALALVWGWLSNLVVVSLVLTVVGSRSWRPSLRFRARDLEGFVGFGAYQVGERTLNYLNANMDYLLIGRFLGPEALGVYSIAFQLAVRPLTQLNPILMRVAIPVFARKQDDDEGLRRGFIEVSRLIAFATFPILVGLAIVAEPFVQVVLGSPWHSSVPLIQILALVGLFKTITNPVGAVFLAKLRADLGFKLNVAVLPFSTLLILAVVREGTVAVAWVSLAVTAIVTTVITPWLLRKLIDMPRRRYAAAFRRPAALTAAMAVVAGGVHAALAATEVGSATVLAAAVVSGAAVYLVALMRLERGYVREIWSLFRGRGGDAVGPPPAPLRETHA